MNGTAHPVTHIEPSIKSTEFGAIQTEYRQIIWFFRHVVVDEATALAKLLMNDVAEAAPPKITTTNETNGYAQMNQNSEMVKIGGFGLKIQSWMWRGLQ